MKNQDRGSRIEGRAEAEPESAQCSSLIEPELDSLNPRSSIVDPVFMERLRWRCRRGLLELDIVLGRFVERDYAGLDAVQRLAFDALLDMPDTVLWDMIAGRQEAEQDNQRALLEKIRAV